MIYSQKADIWVLDLEQSSNRGHVFVQDPLQELQFLKSKNKCAFFKGSEEHLTLVFTKRVCVSDSV